MGYQGMFLTHHTLTLDHFASSIRGKLSSSEKFRRRLLTLFDVYSNSLKYGIKLRARSVMLSSGVMR
jgi:hypothetical protein